MFPETKVLRVPLPVGDRGVAITIGFMRLAASWGQRDPQVRQQALQIVQNGGVSNKDTAGEVQAVYDWVKQHIAFRGELDETVQTPQVTLRFGAGDCDDHSVLTAALLGSIGYQWEFKTVAVPGQNDFTHVYVRVLDHGSGQWIALDTTVDETPGWEPDPVSRAAEWQAAHPRSADMRMGRLTRRRRMHGLGDGAQDLADVIDASSPAYNAIANVELQNYYRNQYGAAYPLLPTQPTFVTPSTLPTWFWPAALTLGGLGIVAWSRSGSGR